MDDPAAAAAPTIMMGTSDMETSFWELKFGVEVSTRYHDWRRGTIISQITLTKRATLVGAIATLITAFNPFDSAPGSIHFLIGSLAVAIAVINLWELTSRLDELALQHTELYRRFADLQAKMSKSPDGTTNEHLSQWAAEAALIRKDEPPTMWAVYAMCWNQSVDRYYGTQGGEHFRKLGWLRHMLRNWIQFRPQDFPLVTSKWRQVHP